MGREVRRVPPGWQHPRDEDGNYIPFHMPEWPESERTHLQMYETTTEGAPISPVMDTPENLARWLADNRASWFADMTATYDQWLELIETQPKDKGEQ